MRTIAYGEAAEHVGDLYLPAGDGPFAAVVLIHGGFWREPYRRDLMSPLAEDLVARGLAAWNIEYRRVGASGGGYPQTLEDVGAALDRLASIEAPVDLARVAAVGHSAGGHLALWSASRHRVLDGAGSDPVVRPLLAVSLAGVNDLGAAARAGVGDGAVRDLLGGDPEQVPAAYAAADPVALLPTGVTTLLVHGQEDAVVPLELSERYVAAAARAGDRSRLEVVDGDHLEVIDPRSRAWGVVVPCLDQAFAHRT